MRCIKRVGDVYLARAVREVGVKMPTYLHLMRSHNMGRTSRMALGVLIACVAVFGLSIMAPQSAMAASSNLKANQVLPLQTSVNIKAAVFNTAGHPFMQIKTPFIHL